MQDLPGKLDALQVEISSLRSDINKDRPARPIHSPLNHLRRKEYLKNLTPEERRAELQLFKLGYFRHEPQGIYSMANLKDTRGNQLHTLDIVKFTEDTRDLGTDELILAGVEGIVVQIISPSEIQIDPINVGLPVICSPMNLEIIYPYGDKLETIGNEADYLALLDGANERLAADWDAQEEKKKEKRAASGKAPLKAKKEVQKIQMEW